MRYALAFLVAFFALGAGAIIGYPNTWSHGDMARIIDQTNFVVGKGCSGTLIDVRRRLIVTAHHCIGNALPDNKPVTVSQTINEGRVKVGRVEYVTQVVAHDEAHDLAILQLVGWNLISTEAAPLLPKGGSVVRGEAVWAIGNPRMQEATITVGIVSSIAREASLGGEPQQFLQFSANIQPGSSGGAIYNSRGQYIGTTVAGMQGSDLALAVSVDHLHDLLATLA